jgi:hypothetical protein
MAKSFKELLNKRRKKKKQRTSSKKKRENIVCIMRAYAKEKKRYIKFINVHETYEKATVGVLFVSCC